MKGERLFGILGMIEDEWILEAGEKPESARKRPRILCGAAAAAAVIVMGVLGIWGTFSLSLRNGQNVEEGIGSGGGSGHEDGSAEFMSYGGPVFPLTLTAREEIVADRELVWSFREDVSDEYGQLWGSYVTDSYTLHNLSDQDRRITMLYPFKSNYASLKETLPELTINGLKAETQLYTGGYAGSFTGAYGAEEEQEGSHNLKAILSWEGYRELLESGDYLEQALAPENVHSPTVKVYAFSNSRADLEAYQAATQSVSFHIDPEKTRLLTYGFEGAEWGGDGYRRYSYFVPDGVRNQVQTKLLVVLGEDITEYSLQGYRDGGCSDGDEIEGVSCEIVSYETTLDKVISSIMSDYVRQYVDWLPVEGLGGEASGPEEELITLEMLERASSALLAENVERYEDGRLEQIMQDAIACDRVFYLSAEAVVSAGADIHVQADLWKEPSFDFMCTNPEDEGIQGYESLTALGSNLDWGKLTAEIRDYEAVEILGQNYGFEPDKGISKVALEPEVERYYMEVRLK